ncbi:Leucyl aminopeptidase [Lentibacillus sp. JNUCC-1]|uniref:leucyl aminopeptidase family protein n=1 Tax=Lentibacillus sp. JNUCC-1 TaxID=2654513 RepID=UPI0012E75E7E|nr:leucyl aminopeptidase family protein [Lentibacillus sp. JNUCC-1]MUV38267.1 Leucyl aminopeptidase [Lentibacillus sp. JNUCC-1]
MGHHVHIVFEQDHVVTGNIGLKMFVSQQAGSFCIAFSGEDSLVVLKEKEGVYTAEQVRMTAGAIARELSQQKVSQATLHTDVLSQMYGSLSEDEVLTAFVEGWHLGTYAFINYRSDASEHKTNLVIEGDFSEAAVTAGEIRAAAMSFSRDLMNDIPSALNPETFPEKLKDAFASSPVDVSVFDKAEIERREMNGVLTVNQGSQYEPAFVELRYVGDASKPLVALVGKGVTFDTGGVSLKRGRDLSDMRMDMGGAAAVSGAMKQLADSGAQVNVIALIPIVENAIDRRAVLPGDIIRYKDGQTVQIGNTDAEGRLILADALIHAGEHGAEYVVDIATLTGAIGNALGSKMAGVFGDDELSVAMKRLGADNGDAVWPMPLVDAYDDYLRSDYADFCNISSKGEAGAITAALFLRRFVPESCKWLHVDMAGRMQGDGKGYYPKTATGFGARLLADYAVYVSGE